MKTNGNVWFIEAFLNEKNKSKIVLLFFINEWINKIFFYNYSIGAKDHVSSNIGADIFNNAPEVTRGFVTTQVTFHKDYFRVVGIQVAALVFNARITLI